MGFFSRLLGIEDDPHRRPQQASGSGLRPATVPNADDQALERYRYMLRTAPPETVEQAHAEAFAKLSPDQRQQVLAELASTAPEAERAAIAATRVDDPQALARVATRAEVRQPGTLERTLGTSGGMGLGGSLLSSFAMGFVGSMVAQSFFSAIGGFGGGAAADAPPADDESSDDALASDDTGADDGGDFGDGGDFDI